MQQFETKCTRPARNPDGGNSFKPFFFGRFEARGDGVYLTGRFTMLGFVKAFMTLWLGGVLAIGIAFAVTAGVICLISGVPRRCRALR
jgi:hypothetical protein